MFPEVHCSYTHLGISTYIYLDNLKWRIYMVNIGNTLKRAWTVLWNYKVLWVFAFLIAISGGAGGGGGNGGGGGGSGARATMPSGRFGDFFSEANTPQWLRDMGTWGQQNVAPLFATEESTLRTIIWMAVGIFFLVIILGLLFSLVRYPAETAVIRMVDEHENTGVKYRFKQGWKLGWNRRAFRMWLIDLVIGAPATGIVLTLIGLMLIFGLGIYRSTGSQMVPGEVIGILFVVLFLIAFALLMIVVNLLRQYIIRYAAIEGTGVWESFRAGWKMFKTNLKDTVLIALVLFGVGIAFGFAMMLAVFLLIPAYAVLTIPGAIVAAIPAGIAYFITRLFAAGILAWIVAVAVAVPLFIFVAFSPLSFLGGMFAVFKSNVWTLTYRQLKSASTPPALPVEQVPPEIELV